MKFIDEPATRYLIGGTALLLAACGGEPVDPGTIENPTASAPAAAAAVPNRWLQRAAYPADMYKQTSAVITNATTGRSVLYVIGGMPHRDGSPKSITNFVKAYDVSANTWSTKAPVPVRIFATNGATVVSGKIYIAGGWSRYYDSSDGKWRLLSLKSLYVYNPATNTWTRKRDMPIATVYGISAAYNGKLYVVTGCTEVVYCHDHYEAILFRYDPLTNAWANLGRTPRISQDGWNPGGGIVGSKLYLVDELGDMDIYDIPTRTWSVGPHRPIRYCVPTRAIVQRKLYLIGCHDDGDGSGTYPMLVYDPVAKTWSQRAAPPIPVSNYDWTASRVMRNGQERLELIGGNRPGNNWQYVP